MLGEHATEEIPQTGGHLRVEVADIRRVFGDVIVDPFTDSPGGERRLAAEHLVERTAQAVDVAADVGQRTVSGLLRGHIIDAADGRAVARDAIIFFVLHSGQAEIGELDPATALVVGKEKIRRFDVAVRDPLSEGVFERLTRLDENTPSFFGLDFDFSPNVLAQVDSVDELHRQVVPAVGLPAFIERDDILMREPGSVNRLAAEAFDEELVLGEFGKEHLESDGALQVLVQGFVHLPHAARGDMCHDSVLADAGTWD